MRDTVTDVVSIVGITMIDDENLRVEIHWGDKEPSNEIVNKNRHPSIYRVYRTIYDKEEFTPKDKN